MASSDVVVVVLTTDRCEGVVEAEALLQEAGLLLGEAELLGAVRPAGARAAALVLHLLHASHWELLLLAAARRLVHVQVPHVVPVPVVGASKLLCQTTLIPRKQS